MTNIRFYCGYQGLSENDFKRLYPKIKLLKDKICDELIIRTEKNDNNHYSIDIDQWLNIDTGIELFRIIQGLDFEFTEDDYWIHRNDNSSTRTFVTFELGISTYDNY